MNRLSRLVGYLWRELRAVGDGVFTASARSWAKVRSVFSGFSFGTERLGA
ncbi:MAG: hypothetical protein ACKVRP_15090 [Bacteroidota bacterium]